MGKDATANHIFSGVRANFNIEIFYYHMKNANYFLAR